MARIIKDSTDRAEGRTGSQFTAPAAADCPVMFRLYHPERKGCQREVKTPGGATAGQLGCRQRAAPPGDELLKPPV